MFYFEDFCGKKVLKSDFIQSVQAFFTTRNGFDFELLESKRIITPNQTHSDNVQIVDSRINYPETDGLITNRVDETIYLRFADCTPLIFYDSTKNIGAVSHAGWRGTFQKIGMKTVQKMVSSFSCNPKDIIVLIGPTISLCCYEVGSEVKEKLLSTVKNKEKLFDGNYIDLKAINAEQLKEIGVEKIDICPYCTSCNNDLFYSYRKENGTKERHYAVLML